jgi:hypothetical protein
MVQTPLSYTLCVFAVDFPEFFIVDFIGRPIEHQYPVVESNGSIGVSVYQVQEVQAAKNGDAVFFIDFLKMLHDGVSQDGVQAGDGFVGQDHGGFLHHGAGNPHPLLLSAAEFVGALVCLVLNANLVKLGESHFDVAFGKRLTALIMGLTYPSLPARTLVMTFERETRLKCWKTMPILRRMRRISSWLAAVTSCPFPEDLPSCGFDQAVDTAQQGGFSRAAQADHSQEFTLLTLN